jgi:hypothetical protein
MLTRNQIILSFILGISAFFFNREASAQTGNEGIYKTESDFHSGRLSQANTHYKKYRIKANEVFYKPYIQVKADDSAFTFYKDSVYGYKDEDGRVYRFFKNSRYQILNPGEKVLVYGVMHHDQKGGIGSMDYYFSKDDQSPIEELTIRNLQRAFKENKTFCEWLDAHRFTTSDLISYDASAKMYVLNKELMINQNNEIRNPK